MARLIEEDTYPPVKPTIISSFRLFLSQPLFEIRRVRRQGGSYTLAIPNSLHSFVEGQKVTITSMSKGQLQELAIGMEPTDKVIVILSEVKKDE